MFALWHACRRSSNNGPGHDSVVLRQGQMDRMRKHPENDHVE